MLVTWLISVVVKMDGEERCQTFLCSLSDSWNSLVMDIGSTSTTLKMEDVVGSIIYKEIRRKVSLNAKETLSVCGRSKNEARMRSNLYVLSPRIMGRLKSLGNSKAIWWKCDKYGHFIKDYKEEKKKQDYNFESEKEDRDAFIAALATHAGATTWLIDSHASFHMTPNRYQFSKYEEYDGNKMYLGDNYSLDIVDHGSIYVKFSNDGVRQFDSVLYILGLVRN